MTEKFTKEEKKQLLKAIRDLCIFEAQTRKMRGYGAFSKDEPMPIPALKKLCDLLEEETK